MSTKVADSPIAEQILDNEFPDELYLLTQPKTSKWACYCHEGIHGVAAFSSENGAEGFAMYIEMQADDIKASSFNIPDMSFDEAREIAKSRPMPVTALMLLDDLEDPKIHYVK